MGKLKDDSNIQIYGWMTTKLKLKGNELIVYAVIYSFSRNDNGNGVYKGSVSYLSEWISGTKATTLSTLQKLLKKELIILKENNYLERKSNVYQINWNKIDEMNRYKNDTSTGTKNIPDRYKNDTSTGIKNIPNNNIYNNTNNNIDNIAAKESTPPEAQTDKWQDEDFKEVVQLYSDNIHPISGQLEADALHDLLKSYGKVWVLDAIKEMALYHGNNTVYLTRILERWQRDGKNSNAAASQKENRSGTNEHRKKRYSLSQQSKVETAEDCYNKFKNETSGWD